MDKVLMHFQIALTILLSWQNGFGWAFRVNINPNNLSDVLPRDVEISCALDPDDCQVKEIMVLEILNPDEIPIAILRQNSQLSIGVGMERTIKTEGGIYANVSESYLKVTLSSPRMQDSGVYNCVVYYLNEIGVVQEMRKNSSLVVNNKDVTSILKNIMERISDLETQLVEQKTASVVMETMLKKQITELETELKQQKNESVLREAELEQFTKDCVENETKMKGQIAVLEAKQSQILQNVSRLETESKYQNADFLKTKKDMGEQMSLLQSKANEQEQVLTNRTEKMQEQLKQQGINLRQQEEKQNYKEAFSAGYTRTVELRTGDVMIFDYVIMNEGQGYNTASGTFTAPRSGFYLFQLNVSERSGHWIDLKLQANDRVLGRLVVGGSLDDQSSISCVTKLTVGDVVKTVVYSRGSPPNQNSILVNRYTTFSGYLLKAL